MLIVVGKSGSGKSTVCKELSMLGYTHFIQATDRPMRTGEVDGRDYIFVNSATFDKMVVDNKFVEYKSYRVANGNIWRYGTINNTIAIQSNAFVFICPAPVADSIACRYPNDVKICYIYADNNTLRDRLMSRGTESIEEIDRRLASDNIDFDDWNHYDFMIDVSNDPPNIIASKIDEIYKSTCK